MIWLYKSQRAVYWHVNRECALNATPEQVLLKMGIKIDNLFDFPSPPLCEKCFVKVPKNDTT